MSKPSGNSSFIDQRLQQRFSMELPVRVLTGTEADLNVQFEGVIANISSGGAFIATDDPLPVSSKVYLEFLISIQELKQLKFILSLETLRRFKGKPVWAKASGVIIRHERNGMAIIFDDDYQLSPLHAADS
jgi:hypothetical protein